MTKFKKLSAWLLALGLSTAALASPMPDEGMWLPMHIKRLNYADMQKAGLKLTADEIYSVNSSSLKDAIVSFGGFCTGEIISGEGLVLTNHHCGYGSIQTHSTVQNDYLTDGFWAKSKKDEIPNKDLSVSFLIRMEDVSARVLNALEGASTEQERAGKIAAEVRKITEEAKANTHYEAQVKSFFNGNEFYLFIYETFKDVRLVGAPPSSVGKFGGDTDNWMWPRHTGDFSLFRVYAGKDGKPAEYSADNVPLKPRHFLPISMSGVKEGDFSMIFGYPGSTDRYLSSFGVDQAINQTNPLRVKIRQKKLDIMKEDMDASDAVRIQYASKYARVSNYWKYFIGQTQGLKRLKVYDKKKAEETAFTNWIGNNSARKAAYGDALPTLERSFEAKKKYNASQIAIQEAAFGVDLWQLALNGRALVPLIEDKTKLNGEEYKAAKEAILKEVGTELKDVNLGTDKKLAAAMLKEYRDAVPADQLPDVYTLIDKKYKGNYNKFVDEMYAKSIFTSTEKLEAFLNKPSVKALNKDLAFITINSFYNNYVSNIAPQMRSINAESETALRQFMKGRMEMQQDRKFYPDANFSMRITYGNVGGYTPRDGVKYNLMTTAEGILDKEDPTNDEFVVPAKLKELIKKKDYGRYGENGELPVCFISNNDITGGNSGSPVINGRGELIGCAFDGNWEAMSGDIAFEKDLQRTISVDIRYVLFIIDKYAGAKHLVDEMKLVYAPVEQPAEAEAKLPVESAPAAAPTRPSTTAKPARRR